MKDIFETFDAEKRQRLKELGCHEAAGTLQGRLMWRLPNGQIVDEDEAFRWAEEQEKTV